MKSPKTAVVNEEFARRIAKSKNLIGRRLFVEATPSSPRTGYEIVGVVRNTKYLEIGEPFKPLIFLPLVQDPQPSLQDQIIIRTAPGSVGLLAAIRKTIADVDGDAHFSFASFDRMMLDSLSRERLMATLSTAFGLLAGILSAVGLYGMMSYVVARRRTEIGLRMALGAGRFNIQAMILSETGWLIAIGLAIGIPLSIAGAHVVRGLLYNAKAFDFVVLATSAGAMTFAALIAAWIPARRAATLDPTVVLREE